MCWVCLQIWRKQKIKQTKNCPPLCHPSGRSDREKGRSSTVWQRQMSNKFIATSGIAECEGRWCVCVWPSRSPTRTQTGDNWTFWKTHTHVSTRVDTWGHTWDLESEWVVNYYIISYKRLSRRGRCVWGAVFQYSKDFIILMLKGETKHNGRILAKQTDAFDEINRRWCWREWGCV